MLDKTKVERALNRLYDEERKLQDHPNYPEVSAIPGYQFITEEIEYFENLLADWRE